MTKSTSSRVVCGTFSGGEIEPGVFHGGKVEPGVFHQPSLRPVLPDEPIDPAPEVPTESAEEAPAV